MNNQRGSIMLVALLIGVGVAIMSGSFVIFLNSQNKLQTRARIQEDLVSLAITAKMLYTEADSCKANLTAAGWGTTYAELKTRSDNNTLKLLYPPGGPATGILAGDGKAAFRNLKEMKFINPVALQATPGYRMDLMITIADSSGVEVKPIIIPFYVVADTSGALIRCFATSYPFATDVDEAKRTITMEDLLCRQLAMDGKAEYAPAGKTCVPLPGAIGAK